MSKYPKVFRSKTCDEFETDLVLHAYGKIASEMRGGVEAHLDACGSCRDLQDQLLQELATAPLDFPQQPFWDDYSREMRRKLGEVDAKRQQAWTWMAPFSFAGITAMAAGVVLVVALGITLKDSIFSNGDPPREDAMIRVLPIVQNLEFFESMHYLEMMEQEPGGDIKSSDSWQGFDPQAPRFLLVKASACVPNPGEQCHSSNVIPRASATGGRSLLEYPYSGSVRARNTLEAADQRIG